MNEKKDIKVPLVVGGSVVFATIAIGSLVLISENQKPTPDTSENAIENTPQTISDYKDGRYYAEASYYVEPKDSTETVGVVIKLENGLISEVKVLSIENGAVLDSENVERFENKAKEEIVGKPINEASGFFVSGSSLTTEAFQNALENIKREAEV